MDESRRSYFPRRKSGATTAEAAPRSPTKIAPHASLDDDEYYPFAAAAAAAVSSPIVEQQNEPLLLSENDGKMNDQQRKEAAAAAEKDEEAGGGGGRKEDDEPAKWKHPVTKVQFTNGQKPAARIDQGRRKSSYGGASADRRRSSQLARRKSSRKYSVSAQQTVSGKVCAVWRNIYTVLNLREWLAVFVMVGYALLGGLLFSWLEQENCRQTKEDLTQRLRKDREALSDKIVGVMNEPWLYHGLAEQRRAVVNLLDEYQTEAGLGPKVKPKWDIWDGVFFSVTVFTTIGYGHYTPVTKLGRLATILYALIGIPLLLAILADFGRVLTRGLKKMWTYMRNGIRRVLAMRRFRRVQRAAAKAGLDFEEEGGGDGIAAEDEEFNFPIPLAIFMIVSWLFICSAFFLIWETGWTYFEAFYFFFISLSTIGLGDIVPEHQKYMILNFPFVLIGLSLVTLVINLIQNKIEEMKEKAENALEDQLGLEYSDTESEGYEEPEEEEDEDKTRFPKPTPEGGSPRPPRGPGESPGGGGRKAKPRQKAKEGRVNVGIIQTFKLPKRRRRVGTQTEDSFVRDIRMRDRKGRAAAYDRYSLVTGNSEYYDTASLTM